MTEELTPWVTGFGDDPDSWNLHLDDDEQDGEGSGLPGLNQVAEALTIYRDLVQRLDPVEVSKVFNLPIWMAKQAVDVPRRGTLPLDALATSDLSSMLGTWLALRGDEPSVALACVTFGLVPLQVGEMVGSGYWLYLTGDLADPDNAFLGIDGE